MPLRPLMTERASTAGSIMIAGLATGLPVDLIDAAGQCMRLHDAYRGAR